jgi:hypothetical protein
MAGAEAWARQQGCGAMRLWSSITRTPAHRFYQGLGYAQVKTQYSFVKALDASGEEVATRLVPRVEPERDDPRLAVRPGISLAPNRMRSCDGERARLAGGGGRRIQFYGHWYHHAKAACTAWAICRTGRRRWRIGWRTTG